MTDILPLRQSAPPSAKVAPQLTAREAAEQLEATFLAEMLKSSGLGAANHSFGGGIGEDQFASFQRDALAQAMVERGGIGLADIFYSAMKETPHD